MGGLFGDLGSALAVAVYRTASYRRLAKAIVAPGRSVHPEASPDEPMAKLGASSLVAGWGTSSASGPRTDPDAAHQPIYDLAAI